MQNENRPAEPIKEYYIAYVDLLGYRKFFKNNADKAENFLKDIHEAIQSLKAYLQGVHSSPIVGGFGQISVQVKVFSDNILLCLEKGSSSKEYLRFLIFIAIVADIQRNFILQYGLFLRGGITIGTLSFNDDFVFGQGLIDVVELEEKAVYPRIIIGPAALDYVLRLHFMKPEDLDKACEIENRAHTGESISDDEVAFCNSILQDFNMEKFYLQWRNHFIFRTLDGAVVLNYLYSLDIDTMLDQTTKEQISELVKIISPDDYHRLSSVSPNQKQRLEQHRIRIIQKINEFGKYNDLKISEANEDDMQERILKKYLWSLSFHNDVCMAHRFPECMIKPNISCDVRFMRITAEIFPEDNPSKHQDEQEHFHTALTTKQQEARQNE